MRITGTHINYLFICPSKLWFFSHHINMEQNSELVSIGKFIHENSYEREKKELQIDGIAIDFVRKGEIIELHEIKKSKKMEKAHEMQAKYYIYVLKGKGIKAKASLDYPLIREKKEITLENEQEILDAMKEVERIVALEQIPEPERKPYCSKCSYYELCWSE